MVGAGDKGSEQTLQAQSPAHHALPGKGDGTGGGPVPEVAASPTCSPNWVTVTTPNITVSLTHLTAVAEVGPTDVWAGGSYSSNSPTPQLLPFFEHWDGASWTIIAPPLAAPGAQSQIRDISVNSANDVWAVGYYFDGVHVYELIYRWNGVQWNVLAGPHPSATENTLYGVAVVSTNNVWAVGYYTVGGVKKTLVEHWNGSNWNTVLSPNLGTGDNALRDVSVVPGSSGNDIWAAGDFHNTPGGPGRTLTLHYDGSSWNYVVSPNQGASSNQLAGIDAIAANDVWAVGDFNDGSISHTLAEHWNGSTWTASPTIDTGPNGNQLVGVFGAASNDVWAAGITIDNSSVPTVLMEHWNGSAWTVSPYTPVGTGSYASGIDGGSGSNLWIVGQFAPTVSAQISDVLVEHYNGAGWSRVYAPSPPTSTDTLFAVSAVSATDIWAVGTIQAYISGQDKTYGITEHWDGTTWSIVTSAHASLDGERLVAVKALSAGNVWVVGYSNGVSEQTFVEHWNGSTWSQIASPNPGGSNNTNELAAVDGISANDVWAVGYYHNGTSFQTLILHWDGTVWLQFTSPNPGTSANYLYDVTVVPGSGGNDAWAVGYFENTGGAHYSSLLERWNGSAWSAVSSPNVTGKDNRSISIFALSANDVWAVGYTTGPGSPEQTLALHWDGTFWTIKPIPQQGPYDNELTDVTGTASNDLYAVGHYITASSQEHGLIEHWNGSAWSVVPAVQTPGMSSLLAGVAAVSSTDVWTVGEWRQIGFDDWQNLAMRYHPCVVSCNISFSDVPQGSTFYPYIHCLACLGIINGYPDGTFKPNNNVTRGQLSKIVSNSAGFNDVQPVQMFQDVPLGSTFQVFIGRLAYRGYISGYACGGVGEPCGPGNLPYFRPNNNATRGQISKIDSNAAGFNDGPSGQQFQDVPVGSTYYTYTYRLVSRNIMSGYACGGAGEPCGPGSLPYFRPNNNATRGQTSKIVGGTFFPDCSSTDAINRGARLNR
jgi:hypothetical protein